MHMTSQMFSFFKSGNIVTVVVTRRFTLRLIFETYFQNHSITKKRFLGDYLSILSSENSSLS